MTPAEIESLVKQAQPYRHVHNREIAPHDLDALCRCANRRQVSVLVNVAPNGRMRVTLKKIMGEG